MELFESLVVVGDVGLVVLLVVELHDFAAYGWFHCAIFKMEVKVFLLSRKRALTRKYDVEDTSAIPK
ncbi:hypothetical protein RJT34_07913 [Clitoria ternatea]|uniref:Transmembrane protein n=1 Tax=Clitoria ternatea TaxID=43366 RepID=A0AAN9K557_CLITE